MTDLDVNYYHFLPRAQKTLEGNKGSLKKKGFTGTQTLIGPRYPAADLYDV